MGVQGSREVLWVFLKFRRHICLYSSDSDDLCLYISDFWRRRADIRGSKRGPRGPKRFCVYMQIEKCQHGNKVKLTRFLTLAILFAHFSMDVINIGSSGPLKI